MIASIGLLPLVLGMLAIRQNVVVILLVAVSFVHLVWGGGRLVYLAEDMWISLNNEVLPHYDKLGGPKLQIPRPRSPGLGRSGPSLYPRRGGDVEHQRPVHLANGRCRWR